MYLECENKSLHSLVLMYDNITDKVVSFDLPFVHNFSEREVKSHRYLPNTECNSSNRMKYSYYINCNNDELKAFERLKNSINELFYKEKEFRDIIGGAIKNNPKIYMKYLETKLYFFEDLNKTKIDICFNSLNNLKKEFNNMIQEVIKERFSNVMFNVQ